MRYEIERWAMTESEMKSILSRIRWSLDLEEAAECDVIIEAIVENYQLKRILFKKLMNFF